MLVINNLAEDLRNLPPHRLVMAVGNFDGLHLGHQAVIGRAVDTARQQEYAAAVLTFKQHPRSVLQPERPPLLLLPPGEKVRRIARMGVDVLVHLDFTQELAAMSAEDFIREVLSRELKVSQIVIGKNFRFGKGRQGCPELLREEGHRLGFQVIVIPPVRIGDEEVSSSRIRQLLLEGDVRKAAILLNRDYEVVGEVVPGDGRGRLIGFPTANLKVLNELIPRDGVYAVWAVFEGKRHPAMMNLGLRPTFPGSGAALEVHLIDFAGDLYGRSLSIHFVERIREERTFAGIDALKRQLALDRSEALQILGPAHSVMESPWPGNLFRPADVNKGGNSH